MNSQSNWTRRDALLSAAGLTGLLLSTEWLDSAHAQATNYESHPLYRLADTLADMVIPQTDTPGASAAKVGGFVLFALDRGMSGLSLSLLEAVQTALNAVAEGEFLTNSSVSRCPVISQISDLQRTFAAAPTTFRVGLSSGRGRSGCKSSAVPESRAAGPRRNRQKEV